MPDIDGAQRPRADEFAAFFDLHFAAVLRRLTFLTQDRSTVEDLCADVFMLAYERFDELAVMPDRQARAWLVTAGDLLGRNRSRSAFRRQRLIERLSREPIDSAAPAPSSVFERRTDARQDGHDVHAVLERLSPQHRELIVMADLERCDRREIAERFGISPQAVRLRLMRARRAFRREYVRTFGIDRRQEDNS